MLLAALGLPLPSTMLVVATGAFSQQGAMSLKATTGVAVMAAVAGDGCTY